MPAVNFSVRWPDGREETCYSPSTVIHQFLSKGDSLSVNDFMERVSKALTLASERVQARYGYACSSANDQLEGLKRRSAEFEDQSRHITILSLINI